MAEWTITKPGAVGTEALDVLGISSPSVNFRAMGISTAALTVDRDYDSTDPWWAADALVTIYRNAAPYFTGRVQETPSTNGAASERRMLNLSDAWQDLEEIIYQEPWPIGSGTALFPRAILGRDSAGALITTGQQISEAVAFAISRGAGLQIGTVDSGMQLWPSEVKNSSCESVISEQLRYHPDWTAWIDHSTFPPTFHARALANLDAVTVDIAGSEVEAFGFSKLTRNVPNGVRVIYESADTIDGEVMRNGYEDTAGDISGRKVMMATLELEGMQAQFQKSQVETLDLPDDGDDAGARAYLKKKFPALAMVPDASWAVANFSKTLVVEDPLTLPPPICSKAERLAVADVEDLPRELVRGSLAEWMRKKVGRVTLKVDFLVNPAMNEAHRKIFAGFEGESKTWTVTATNATTKTYKGISSFTEGEGRPIGLAAAIFSAATADQYEGVVTVAKAEVDATRWHGKKLVIIDGINTLMPGAIIYSGSADIEAGSVVVDFGPPPYLSAGDFLELQRMFKRRPVTWMSAQERTSNKLGADDSAGSLGDTVDGFDAPDTVTPPGGGGGKTPVPFWPEISGNTTDGFKLKMVPGYVATRKMGTADAADNLAVGSIPTALTVAIGDKMWVTATESVTGEISSPVFAKGSTWQPSTAPKLKGGSDDQVGVAGTRIWRLCEVISDGADGAKMTVWRTGIIEHFAARAHENAVTSVSTGEARILKEYDLGKKQWLHRILRVESGSTDKLEITESGDYIDFKILADSGGGSSGPFLISVSKVGADCKWQVSSAGSTITDGTSGDSLEISTYNSPATFSATKYIVVEASVTALAVSSLNIAAVDDPDEVGMAGTPPEQDMIRLLLGKVSIVDGTPVAQQFLFTAARLTYGFLDGKIVRVFEAAPSHEDSL